MMNESFNRIRGYLSPEEVTELDNAVRHWNTLSPTQWRDLLSRPRENHSLFNRQMLEVLERHGLVRPEPGI